ncbi:Fructose-2,6-bisphosphatase [Gloeomargarita lithophora Alchichica-D10]|uniref:Fructose-2,6-bisphosphatase n=1 Tax=Gloeomargarita lithophora Alchichica-D10 TaxID=1188229 RepID=A0A1J0AH41_9CYAN|nr:histidine phosphatase family protein [Gloeomargarita lithophora]APB35216.1 Fructose-2,6-bisphosphatase [Gloeomargarita lithophora Alchichica-D10]
MGLHLYFLRHGETVFSKSGNYSGSLDPELTAQGQQMAADFAQAYQALPWTAVFCSPMRRTMATATPLAQAVGLELQLRDGLKEIHYGVWEGQTPAWVKQNHLEDYIHWMTEPAWNAPTGGETAVQIANRAMAVIAEIEANYTEGNVLVVSHKATLRIILCSLLGIDLGRFRDRISILVASVSLVRFTQYGPRLELMGDRSHLNPELRALAGT